MPLQQMLLYPKLDVRTKRTVENSIDDFHLKNVLNYDRINMHFEEAFKLYEDMLADGVAKECKTWCYH